MTMASAVTAAAAWSPTVRGSGIAVISDGSLAAYDQSHRTSAAARLAIASAQIERFAHAVVLTKVIRAGDPLQFIGRLRDLPDTVKVIFLAGVSPGRAHLLQRAMAACGGPVVLTEQDAIAVSMVAGVLTSLRRAGRPRALGRVMIIGAQTAPLLGPLLAVAGIGEIDSWNPVDALDFGLNRLAFDADVIIDLIGGPSSPAQMGRRHPVVISPVGQLCTALTMPGMLRAVLDSVDPVMDIQVFHSCAKALALRAPENAPLAELPDAQLVEIISAVTTRALHRKHRIASRTQ